MSDVQEPLIVLQRRVQQRQILAMMGIDQWAQPNSATLNIADISAAITANPTSTDTTTQAVSSAATIEQPSIEHPKIDQPNNDAANIEISNIASVDSISAVADDEPIRNYHHDSNDTALRQPDAHSPVNYSFDSISSDISVTILVDNIVQQTAAPNADINNDDSFQGESFKKVAPFDLQGGRYGNWVILVDIQALNNDSQKLWQNITQALSISCETASFPICDGMDTAELANASLAGYVFKIGRSEEIKVMSLTALPEGLDHPKFTVVPTLDEMLADSSLKRQFWELISSQN